MSLTAADRTVNGVLGFDKNNVLVAQLNLPERSYGDAETRRRFITEVSEAMRAIPAVSDIGATSIIPNAFNNNEPPLLSRGRGAERSTRRGSRSIRSADNGYFAAHEDSADSRPLVRRVGSRRWPRRSRLSAAASPVRYWGDGDPIGKRFKLAVDGPWITVIGVTGDVVHNWFVRQFETVYRPLSQTAPYSVAFALRTVGDPNALGRRSAARRIEGRRRSADRIAVDARYDGRGAGRRLFVHRARARRGRR